MPKSEKIIVYTDGGSRGNPGPAAVGVVVLNESGQKLKEYGAQLEEVSTNNEAEYEAVIFALKKLKQFFGKEKTKSLAVEFRVDSELIASQLAGEYKVNEERMQMLFMKVWNLKFDFGKLIFKSVPREANKRADELVNQALDGKGESEKLL
ncbi:MAG: ribonuclease HI family protein [Candidatus Sungbacteria bacterium]|uniref:Ribonuclease HI family protein n=1 Tax=Candidatus Sungiibacteriota bacterium TaxID=2750080 RepID=A0A931YD20_9BACT|nr:ribonuclease HI family protein [Candidatus Sungbacteria bacterium]MBI2465695.1 ribonuclease HI family protein [Candidatus Sungbacteria bacterium]